MCWLGKIDKKNFLTEDIFCYKVLTPGLISVYKNFQYSLNELYTTELLIPQRNISYHRLLTIEHGFHSYSTNCEFLLKYRAFSQHVQIRSKLRDDGSYFILDNISPGCLVYCQIPEGAECYENRNGEIVSNKIIIKNVVATI